MAGGAERILGVPRDVAWMGQFSDRAHGIYTSGADRTDQFNSGGSSDLSTVQRPGLAMNETAAASIVGRALTPDAAIATNPVVSRGGLQMNQTASRLIPEPSA